MKLKIKSLLLCLSLSLFSSDSALLYISQAQEIVISQEDWNQLKRDFETQNIVLNELETRWTQLKKESEISKEESEKSERLISESRKAAEEAQKSLMGAQNSLSEARQQVETLKISLQKLKDQIDYLTRTNKRLIMQRNIAEISLGILGGYGIWKKLN